MYDPAAMRMVQRLRITNYVKREQK